MLKRYVSVLFIGLLWGMSLSPTLAQENWHIFLDGGVDNVTILKNGNTQGSSLTTPFVGLDFNSPAFWKDKRYHTFSDFRIDFNLGYTAKGAAFNKPNYKHRFHYGQLTIRPTFKVMDAFDAFIGVQTARFALSTKENTSTLNNEQLLLPSPANWDLSGQLGIGASLSPKLGLNLSYQRSFTSVGNSFYHNGFRLGLKYRLTTPPKDQIKKEVEKEVKRQKKAQKHIEQLKEGLLLVRLKSKRKKLRHFRENHNPGKAQKLYRQTNKKNRKIRKAFKDSFDFCQVRFFYDYKTEQVLNGEWEETVFSHDSSRLSQKMLDKKPKFYIADVEESFVESTHQLFKGAVIRDQNLKALPPPFPNKISDLSNFAFLGATRTPYKLMYKLNKELWDFYQ